MTSHKLPVYIMDGITFKYDARIIPSGLSFSFRSPSSSILIGDVVNLDVGNDVIHHYLVVGINHSSTRSILVSRPTDPSNLN